MFKPAFKITPYLVSAFTVAAVAFAAPSHAQSVEPGVQGPRQGPPAAAMLQAMAQRNAQDSLTIGLGAGFAPRFIGSDDYIVNPFPFVEWRFDGGRVLRTSQFGFELDVTRGSKIDFGPIIRIDTGRGDFQGAGDPVVDRLGDVAAAPQLGAFIATTRPVFKSGSNKVTLVTARLSALRAIGGHDGIVIEGSAGVIRPGRKWTTVTNVTTSIVSDAFNRSYFGVDAAQSARSGLRQFNPEGGMRDLGLSNVISYSISPKWSVINVASYSRLLGDAANGPVTDVRGSANQFFFGLNLSYKVF